jgi:hypothetical protein
MTLGDEMGRKVACPHLYPLSFALLTLCGASE